MAVDNLHPSITADRKAEWQLTRDALDGESQIKARGETYLAKPSGFNGAPDQGAGLYRAYKMRAQFPEILSPSVASMIGIIHSKETEVVMPDAMQGIWERATNDEQPATIEAFHRRITRSLLTIGRFAVLADAPLGGGDPYLVGYDGDAVINWDRDFFVVDESGMVRNGFDWVDVKKYRVFTLEDGRYVQTVYTGDNLQTGEVVTPRATGGKMLDRVPFAIASAVDLSPRIITPPMIGVSRAALAIYQLSADYRWQLFMSGQETLFVYNADAPATVGAGVVVGISGSDGLDAKAEYVGPSCLGIAAHLAAMDDNRKAAINAGARLFESTDKAQESGEARKLRFASETATLMSVAQASAGLLEMGLRDCARFMGLNPEDVVVTPPTDLMDQTITPDELAKLFDIYERGGLSWETYHEAGTRGGLFSPERDSAQEYAALNGDGDLTGADGP